MRLEMRRDWTGEPPGELTMMATAGAALLAKVMAASLSAAHELGEDFLSLGVMHANLSAHRLYQSMGFTLMHNFTYCERR